MVKRAFSDFLRTPPATAALRSGLRTKNLSLWTVIGAAPKSSGFRWWTQAAGSAGLRRKSSRSFWRAFKVPARSRQLHGATAFRGRCCCDGAGLFIPSQRIPPAHNLASSQRSWSQIQRCRCGRDPYAERMDERDDPDSKRRQRLDSDRPHRHAPRHAKPGAGGSG